MFKQAIFLISCALLVSGCANGLQRGNEAYNIGQYDLAAQYWNPLAQNGDLYAQHNLGILWERGLGATQKNDAEAAVWYLSAGQQGYTPSMVALARVQRRMGAAASAESWLNLAARWNDQEAISSLRAWAKPIPAPDLYYAQELYRLRAQEKLAEGMESLGYALGCLAAGGGCSSTDTSYSYSTPVRATKTIPTYQEENRYGDDPPIVGVGMGLCSGPGLDLGLGVTQGDTQPEC